MMSYLETISLRNRKNSCFKKNWVSMIRLHKKIQVELGKWVIKKLKEEKSIYSPKTKNIWLRKTLNWLKRIEDMRIGLIAFRHNFWMKKIGLNNFLPKSLAWQRVMLQWPNRKSWDKFPNWRTNINMNYKWPRIILWISMRNKLDF